MPLNMTIRPATKQDFISVWDIFHAVIQQGDTYVFPEDTPQADLATYWFAEHMHTYVVEIEGKVVATYILKPNQVGRGGHVANGSFMVHPAYQGQGIGKDMCEHCIAQATRLGFYAIQFNLVISTNTAAIRLWERFGFSIIGTIPEAFHHKKLGLVDAHIMYRVL
jgi:L-amino acid N-acyltransferase YncA